jgi:hypothetical protein
MVHELTSLEGDVYRRQSCSQIVDPTLTIQALETLEDRLDLPDGWSYEARVLDADSALVSQGLAYVINDESSMHIRRQHHGVENIYDDREQSHVAG